MHLGVFGTGDVGRALASGLARHGHQITMGTRTENLGKLEQWLGGRTDIRGAPLDVAATACEAAVLCTSWSGTENALRLAGPNNLAGKVVVDVTNPLSMGDAGPTLAVSGDDSAGEQVQRWLPEARVVKCWNIVGNPYMVDPDLPDGPPTMFIAGDDADAKAQVAKLLDGVGWPDCVDLGGIENARYLESMAMVWIRTYMQTGAGKHAFRLLRG